jgi:hypothetical protein
MFGAGELAEALERTGVEVRADDAVAVARGLEAGPPFPAADLQEPAAGTRSGEGEQEERVFARRIDLRERAGPFGRACHVPARTTSSFSLLGSLRYS